MDRMNEWQNVSTFSDLHADYGTTVDVACEELARIPQAQRFLHQSLVMTYVQSDMTSHREHIRSIVKISHTARCTSHLLMIV